MQKQQSITPHGLMIKKSVIVTPSHKPSIKLAN